MTNYPVGDFLIQIKNAALARRREVTYEKNKFVLSVARALKDCRYLSEVEEKDGKIVVKLAYSKKEPRLIDLKLVSKPGLRIYMSVDELEAVKSPSIYLISTPKGVLSSLVAKKNNLGGEVIVEVW